MANETQQAKPADVKLRNEFAGIALREIVRYQLTNSKFGEQSLAASLAFKWADHMVLQSQQPPARATIMVKGATVVYEPPPPEPKLPESEMIPAELPGGPVPA